MVSEIEAMVGREHVGHDVCVLPLAQRLAALLNLNPGIVREGDPLPFGWHGMLFAPSVPSRDLSEDGTASDTTFLANPDGFPRRMAGGRRIQQLSPIVIGSKVTRRSFISTMEQKSGRSGPMIVATVRHEIGTSGNVLLVEDIDTIFFEAKGQRSSSQETSKTSEEQAPSARVARHTSNYSFSNVDLFRFSSVVFNSHRIHYDLQYAREVEGYPDLVVNGSISTLFLSEFCRTAAGWNLRKVRTRNLAPLFANSQVRLCLGSKEGRPLLWAETEGGVAAIEVEILEHD